MTAAPRVVHPFPARMAPEIARNTIAELDAGSTLLDPMCGSGTVLRSSVEHGITAFGFDIDPLAILMSNVWVTAVDHFALLHDANQVVDRAKAIEDVTLPWIDDDTAEFIEYWFAPRQRAEVSRLAFVLRTTRLKTRDALLVALSRVIITKDRGASLARDVSHSRPHRAWVDSEYDVYEGFLKSARALAARLTPELIRAKAIVERGDARDLSELKSSSIDCVVTSPPYLNALDYMRGHRLSLVWMGYPISETSKIRALSVGSERALNGTSINVDKYVNSEVGKKLSPRHEGWVRRYFADAQAIVSELTRVLKPSGRIVFAIGNSYLRGCQVDNAGIYEDVLLTAGARIVSKSSRVIPARRRYLPPPSGTSALATRMRTEIVLSAING